MAKKAFPMDAAMAAHMGEEGHVKFTGKEGEWEVFEASQNGARVGYAMMTHSDLPGGGDMHIAFAVDKGFKITKAKAVEAPDAAKMDQMLTKAVGKAHGDSFKVGKGLQAPVGLAASPAQTAADALHKGLLILEENFNPNHSGAHSGAHSESEHSH